MVWHDDDDYIYTYTYIYIYTHTHTKSYQCSTISTQLHSMQWFQSFSFDTNIFSCLENYDQFYYLNVKTILFETIQLDQKICVHMWDLKGLLKGQGLRARLCCRKISDSIFWLYYFTPRWLAGAMPCLKKSKRNIQKEKIETDKRQKHFFHTFLYLLGEWTNQRYVLGRSVVPKTRQQNDVVGSTDTAWQASVHRKPEYLSLSTGSKFATPKSF